MAGERRVMVAPMCWDRYARSERAGTHEQRVEPANLGAEAWWWMARNEIGGLAELDPPYYSFATL
jgi:hypothetical protein